MERYKTNVVWLWAVAIAVVVGLIGGMNASYYRYMNVIEVENSVGCNGTEFFFSGEGFKEDAFMYKALANSKSNKPEMWILEPKDYKNETYDCEDISHGIMCLAEKYDVECNYYFTESQGRLDGYNSHVGVGCWVDGIWRVEY